MYIRLYRRQFSDHKSSDVFHILLKIYIVGTGLDNLSR